MAAPWFADGLVRCRELPAEVRVLEQVAAVEAFHVHPGCGAGVEEGLCAARPADRALEPNRRPTLLRPGSSGSIGIGPTSRGSIGPAPATGSSPLHDVKPTTCATPWTSVVPAPAGGSDGRRDLSRSCPGGSDDRRDLSRSCPGGSAAGATPMAARPELTSDHGSAAGAALVAPDAFFGSRERRGAVDRPSGRRGAVDRRPTPAETTTATTRTG